MRLLHDLAEGLRARRATCAASMASHGVSRRSSFARLLAGALLIALCASCGGEATDTVEPASPAGSSSTGGASGPSGGAPNASGGTASGGASSGGVSSGGGAVSTGGAPSEVQYYWCYNWSDLENEPVPGKVGIEACPSFDELDPVVPESPYCYAEGEPYDPTTSTAPEPPAGDCCYGLTYYHCR